MPNLIIRDVDVGNQDISPNETVDESYSPGSRFSVVVDIENDGAGPAGSSVAAIFMGINGQAVLMDTNSTGSISAGGTDANETLSFDIPDDLPDGFYPLVISVDYLNQVAETDETDNTQGFGIQVVQGTPNIVISDVDVGAQDISQGETVTQTYAPGETFTVVVDVENTGNADAPSSSAGVYMGIDGQAVLLDTNSSGILDAGETNTNETLSFVIPQDLADGTYAVVVSGDALNNVVESDEADNSLGFAIVVRSPVTTYSISPNATSITEGNEVTFTITRSNDLPAETVYFSTLSGTATFDDGDYRLDGGGRPENVAVVFTAGQTSRSVTIDVLSGDGNDSPENFRAIVQRNPSDLPDVFLDRSAFVTINEAAQNTTYDLTVSDETPNEGDIITFTIRRTGDRPAETILFSTLQETANYPEDYVLSNGGGRPENVPIIFANGAETATIGIRIVNDGPGEGVQTFGALIEKDGQELDEIFDTFIRIGEADTPSIDGPDLAIDDLRILPLTTIDFRDLVSGDLSNIVSFEIWDRIPDEHGSGFYLDGEPIQNGYLSVLASDISNLEYVGGSEAGSNYFEIVAYDAEGHSTTQGANVAVVSAPRDQDLLVQLDLPGIEELIGTGGELAVQLLTTVSEALGWPEYTPGQLVTPFGTLVSDSDPSQPPLMLTRYDTVPGIMNTGLSKLGKFLRPLDTALIAYEAARDGVISTDDIVEFAEGISSGLVLDLGALFLAAGDTSIYVYGSLERAEVPTDVGSVFADALTLRFGQADVETSAITETTLTYLFGTSDIPDIEIIRVTDLARLVAPTPFRAADFILSETPIGREILDNLTGGSGVSSIVSPSRTLAWLTSKAFEFLNQRNENEQNAPPDFGKSETEEGQSVEISVTSTTTSSISISNDQGQVRFESTDADGETEFSLLDQFKDIVVNLADIGQNALDKFTATIGNTDGTSLSENTIYLNFEAASTVLDIVGQESDKRIVASLGSGNDQFAGGGGHDFVLSGTGNDEVHGGAGDDVVVDAFGSDQLFGDDDDDRLVALSGENVFFSGTGHDLAVGGIGGDTLYGANGNDILIGDIGTAVSGRDTLVGGFGDDLLSGGGGADTFIFRPAEGTDIIGQVEIDYVDLSGSFVSGRDFQTEIDVLEFIGFGYATPADVLSNFENVSGNAIFSDQGTTVVLFDILVTDLTSDNFVFG
ncbi:CARDB domain-containing protein [Yoonia sp. R2-816]|uniref:CARDB domain-containing protein n=1 Tax=Yoonia sp. R2-816 TaxID=3342638 RepID=UPI00372A1B9F